MEDVVAQAASLLLLGGVMGMGYRRWVRPHRGLTTQQRGLLVLVLLTLAGGAVGAPFWWFDEPRSFAWDLPPLAARLLAAAGWSFALVCLLALRRPTGPHLRLIALMLVVYLTPLAVAIPLVHRDRFDWRAPISYAFLLIVGVMTVLALWYLLRPVSVSAMTPQEGAPPTPAVRGFLGLVAALMGLWGLALWWSDHGPSGLIWIWPGDLLTSRLIGVMLLTVAASAWAGRRHASVGRLALTVMASYGLGGALAAGWALLTGALLHGVYVVVFGLLGLTALAVLRRGPARIHG